MSTEAEKGPEQNMDLPVPASTAGAGGESRGGHPARSSGSSAFFQLGLDALWRIGQELNSTLDLKPILDLLIREGARAMDATRGMVLVVDREKELQPFAWYGYSVQEAGVWQYPGEQRRKQLELLLPRALSIWQAGASLEATKVATTREGAGLLPAGPGSRSEITLPICYGQELVGVIDLQSTDAKAQVAAAGEVGQEATKVATMGERGQAEIWGALHQQFALALAELAGTAIGNAHRYAEQVERERAIRQRNAQLRDLMASSHALHTGQDLEDILDEIVQAIPATGGFNVAMLSLVEGDPPVLHRVAVAGVPLAQFRSLQEVRQPLSAFERAWQEQYRIGNSYLLPHQKQEDWEPGLDTHIVLQEDGTWHEGTWHPSDMLLLPLRGRQGQLLGLLSLDDPQDRQLPNRERIEILELLANEAASAIENMRLHDELEQRVQKRTEELADALRVQAAEVDKTVAIVESISDAVIVFEPGGNVVLANPASERILGLGPGMLLQLNLNDEAGERLKSSLQVEQEERLESSLRGGERPDEEEAMIEALLEVARSARRSLDAGQDLIDTVFQGAGRVIHASFSATRLPTDEPLTMVAVLRDVTRETQIDRRKSESIATAAHELRAPMTSMIGYADMLIGGVVGSVNEKQKDVLGVIKANAHRLSSLVNNLLDVAKMESEEWKLDLRHVSLNEVVTEAVATMRKQIETKEQQLVVDVAPGLPQVMADRTWMIQVVANLLSNAHKYSPPGSQVAVRGVQVGDQLWLDIEDAGIGISAQDQKHLFTRFFRTEDAILGQERGTGLGLAICREIVVRHGGQVQVNSELGKGSTFRIVLPLAQERE